MLHIIGPVTTNCAATAPKELKPEIRTELEEVERMDAMTNEVGSAYLSKMTHDSYHRMNRKRGRTLRPDDETDLT